MSASSEYESTARQDYGPATSSENVYEHVLDHKLTENMNIQSIRTPVLRAVPLSSNEGDPEPDSTNHESIIQSVNKDKEVEYHIAEKRSDAEMSVDTLANIVRIDETNCTIDNVRRIAYPIIQETDDSNERNYVENSATLIQGPLSTAIVQNVTKLPQNFTINVDAAVSNITTIQNVSQDVSGAQTLWLPTILASSAPATDAKPDDDRTQPGVSQIIITSESYANDNAQVCRRSNIVTETSYLTRPPKTSKVQILSNISLPKYSQQYITQTKELVTPVYATQSHVYKLSTNVVSQKHINSSVLCTKPPKTQSLIGCSSIPQSVINSSPIKNVAYSHTFAKTTNINKTLNKVNNGANLNAMVAASSGSTPCHILSRVMSGPNKMSVHSGRKSVNALKASKSGQATNQKNQSRPIKIIQQMAAHKSEQKSWPVASVTYKTQPTYGVVDSNTSKIIQKVGSPTGKTALALPKFPSKGERVVLQSGVGPVLVSAAGGGAARGPHYVQSGATPNLRYVQAYGADAAPPHVSANQQLTAQILHSLAQPKLMLHAAPPAALHPRLDEPAEIKPLNQRRIVMGDKSTLLTADDLIGMEERPNLSEELHRYSFQPLAFIMLDHTYSQPAQKQPPPSPARPSPPPAAASPPAPLAADTAAALVSPPTTATIAPVSPLKRTSPVIVSTATYEPTAIPIAIPPSTPTSSLPPQGGVRTLPARDDDAASAISSREGSRSPPPAGGSDTETAPEGEDEGKTRCVCEFTHDDGYMICCDRCGEWQHVDCMGIDRGNIPDAYMCEVCLPRAVDRRHARHIQLRKREELSALAASDSDSSSGAAHRRRRLLTVTTYTDTAGSCVTTYNSTAPVLPHAHPPPQPPPPAPHAPAKRGPKRPPKKELVRKVPKRKMTEKRVKRKKEMALGRAGKYGASQSNASHWQDAYEQAVTNHYSPELRAKIAKYGGKLGGGPELSQAAGAHHCTTVPHAGGKILIATRDLRERTPVTELRGKYMLSAQHRPQPPHVARAQGQKPGPFVFFYRLPRDNIQICIDTRTYGNEARFVRRSCKPNAELQHCIVKGTLHVYLVTTGVIQANTEITVGHDSDGGKHPCACGNPKHCKINGLNAPLPPRKSLDYPPLREKRSRNRCFSSSSPVSPPPAPALTTPVKESPFVPSILTMKPEKSPVKHEYPPLSPAKPVIMSIFEEPMKAEAVEEPKPEIDLTAKEEMRPEEFDEPDYCKIDKIEEKLEKMEMDEICNRPAVILPIKVEPEVKQEEPEPPVSPVKDDVDEKPIALSIPLPIHPPKVTPKVIERRRSRLTSETKVAPPEPKETKEVIKKEEPSSDDEKLDKLEEKMKTEEKKVKEKADCKVDDEKPLSKEVTAKSACHDRSSRSSRTTCVNQDSMDDKTDDSQDKIQPTAKEKRKMTREERKMEAIMKAFERMEKAEQRKQEVKERQKRRESDPHPNAMDRDDDDEVPCATKRRKRRKGRARTTSQSNRRRLNSADSDLVTSGDEGRHSPHRPPSDDTTSEHVNEDLSLSSACLLVEAAVGSVENAFKLPKTKKTMATEWIGRSPERTPSPYRSPYRPALVSAPSLESLVRVASTMIGDLSGQPDSIDQDDDTRVSPPRTPGRDRNRPPKKSRRITRSTPPAEVPEVTPQVQHSAKKRWLRQAISEESDPPCTAESPPNEMITPLKKRRLARESLSCEPNTIVPCTDETSPVLTSEDSPIKDDPHSNRQYKVRNIMDSIYGRDRTRSDSGQGSDDQCNMMEHDVLNVNIKGPHAQEDIRRIIGVPTPEDEMPPDITKPEDIRTNNNNVDLEESNYNKAVPMEIDTTTIPQPKIQDTMDGVHINSKRIESPTEKLNSSQSADTSGNSSPQRDEMDDIQKKIHSFHTENIMILKSRNKKPKEKRKKVNLNFDLNMVDDQISIQLRTENERSPEINGDLHDDMSNDMKCHVSPENIPLPPDDSMSTPLPAPENIPLPEEPSPMPMIMPSPETIPLPEEPMKPQKPVRVSAPASPKIEEKTYAPPERPSVLENSTLPFSTRFGTGLFSGIFNNITQPFNAESSINENVPNMSIIKSAIDRSTSLDSSLFDKDISQKDDMKSVQEILTRVNNMDSNSSVILSGVLKSSNKAGLLTSPLPKPAARYCPRTNDPRLNPPPQDKPKPIRRKLSISEYRKRQSGAAVEECGEPEPAAEAEPRAPSPQRLDVAAAAAARDLEARLHRELADSMPKGVFDAQPTASERQREDLSSRLRREFGLALPDEAPPDGAEAGRCDR